MIKSRIEELICDRSFSYLRPYFYNNRFSMRCELGKGQEDYAENAKKRATEIFNILFPAGADAIIFNYWLFDYSESGEAEKLALTIALAALSPDLAEPIRQIILFAWA